MSKNCLSLEASTEMASHMYTTVDITMAIIPNRPECKGCKTTVFGKMFLMAVAKNLPNDDPHRVLEVCIQMLTDEMMAKEATDEALAKAAASQKKS